MKEKLLAAGCIAVLTGSLILATAKGEEPAEKLSPVQESAIRKVGEEIKSLRSENKEVFKTGKGAFKTRIFSKHKYYYDSAGDSFALPDLSIHGISALKKLNPFRSHDRFVDAGRYRATWFDDKTYDYKFYSNDHYVKYTAFFDTADIEIITKPKNTGIKQDLILKSTKASHKLSWLIDTSTAAQLSGSEVVYTDSGGNIIFRTPIVVWDNRNVLLDISVDLREDTLTVTVPEMDEASYPITIDPTTTIVDVDAASGRLRWYVEPDSTWAAIRNNAVSEDTDYTNSFVGSWIYLGDFSIWRVLMRFDTSSLPDDATIDSVRANFVGGAGASWSAGQFLMVVKAKDTIVQSGLTTDMYNDFDGWTASDVPFTPTYLADSLAVQDAAEGDTLTFIFNTAGKNIISNDDTTSFFVLDHRDVHNLEPTGTHFGDVEDDSPYLEIWYKTPTPPANFTMTALGPYTIACAWEDSSDYEEKFYIINVSDMSVVDSTAANAEADTIGSLSENTKYVWMVAADSAGVRGYSNHDSTYTLLNPPTILDISVMPISSDTLRISVTDPPNGTSGSTGMDVDAVSGNGATSSGWLAGEYSYLDGGLNPDSIYVYKVRLKNGDGVTTGWSPEITFGMKGLETLVVNLTGDLYDDYNTDFGNGQRGSTVIRVGASDSGERLDGFVSFTLPWAVVNGGVDSLFLTMNRAGEESSDTPAISVYGLPLKQYGALEERLLGLEDSTAAAVSWTVAGGTGARTSPELRNIFREWQDFSNYRYFSYDFGFRLDDSSQTAGVRAVFQDYSHPSYSNGTSLTIYYTPGYPDSVEYAPDDFSMTVLSPDSINASWSDNSAGEYGFVLLNFSDSTLVAGIDSLDRNTESVNVGVLAPNTVYDWFIRAYSGNNDSSSSNAAERTFARTPGNTTVSAITETALHFTVNPVDNPSWTTFAVQDSVTGSYVDGDAEPDTLRSGPPGDWGWKTFVQWGSASGDTLSGLMPDSLYVLRAKAKRVE